LFFSYRRGGVDLTFLEDIVGVNLLLTGALTTAKIVDRLRERHRTTIGRGALPDTEGHVIMRDKATGRKAALTRTITVLEVCYEVREGSRWLTVVSSLAGRDDVAERHWPVGEFLPDAAVLADLVAFASKEISDGVVTMLGVQRDLPLE
jgi:hypothetical protein